MERKCEHHATETAINNAREMQKQAAKSAKDAGKNKGIVLERNTTKHLPYGRLKILCEVRCKKVFPSLKISLPLASFFCEFDNPIW